MIIHVYSGTFIVKFGDIYFCNPAVMMTNNLCCVTLPSVFAEEMRIKANRLGPFYVSSKCAETLISKSGYEP